MTSALPEWHDRYQRQAQWTSSLRAYLYERAALPPDSRVLDVGCGSGVLLDELSGKFSRVFGLDLEHERTAMAMRKSPQTLLVQTDAHCMSFESQAFDLVLCHFLLLWVNEPSRVVSEMARLTRPGGVVMVFAEPDYGGRIDYPETLELLGQWQTDSLRQQGADPTVGRKLAGFFKEAGLSLVESGVLGGQWRTRADLSETENEWEVLCRDLSGNPEFTSNLEDYRQEYFSAWERGTRVLFVPTFYAMGRK